MAAGGHRGTRSRAGRTTTCTPLPSQHVGCASSEPILPGSRGSETRAPGSQGHWSRNWPVSSIVARTFKSIALAVVLIAVMVLAWRWMRPQRDAAAGATSASAPSRGGALTASTRSDPPSYNRYVSPLAAVDLVSLLTQASLVRVNRANDELEPWLAERWTSSPDGQTYT